MPLKEGNSRAVIAENIQTEMAAGKSRSQAIAIALRKSGKSRSQADGSSSPDEGETGSRTSPESVAPSTKEPKPPKQHTKQPAAPKAEQSNPPAESGGGNVPRIRGPRFLQRRAERRSSATAVDRKEADNGRGNKSSSG